MKILLFFLSIWWIYGRSKVKPLETDILIAPGGYKGIYMIGICHYLKNHFILDQKTITGLSCGSLLSLFLALNPELDNRLVSEIFKIEHKRSMSFFLKRTLDTLRTQFKSEDFDLDRIQVGVTTWKGMEFFDKFLTLGEALQGCAASCFVPFVTSRDLMMVYHNRLSLDGGVFYKRLKAIRRKETFLITSSMFGRYIDNPIMGFRKPSCTYYQMYLNGYSDARKNHAVFEAYFDTKLFQGP